MLKSSIVCVLSGFLLIVSVNGDFSGIQTKSTGSNSPEEPSVNAEQRTTEDITTRSSRGVLSSEETSTNVNVKQGIPEDNQDYNDEGDSTTQTDKRLEDSAAEDPLGNERDDGELENTVTRNSTCGSPPEIEGAVEPDLDDTEHAVGTVIKYRCKIGYVSRSSGGFPSICKINETTRKAEWTKPEISCSPRSCGDPGYVTNARRIGNLFTFPNKVEFECDEGYKLKGFKSRYCQARGDWSGTQLPTCEVINCSAPANPVNGRVSYSSLGYGSELRYECNRGFALKNHMRRVCAADGDWTNKEPDCIEVACEMPLQPERGTVQFSDGQAVGSIATYSCEKGTTLVGVSTFKCSDNGNWPFDPPKCLRSCKIPEIRNGVIGFLEAFQRYRQTQWNFVQFQVGETVKHGASVTVHCDVGFIPMNLTTLPNGGHDVWCNDGVWSKSMQCAPSRCLGEPPSIENGSPVVGKDVNGSVIYYQCTPGSRKVKGHIECVYGTWEGQPPVCVVDTRCRTNGLNYPGLKLPTEEYFLNSQSFEITCEEGYQKISSKKRIKCFKGKWEVESNPCSITDQTRCRTTGLNYPGLKLPTEEYFLNSQSFQITCEEGYQKISPKKNIKCLNGKWEVESNPCSKRDLDPVATQCDSHEFPCDDGSCIEKNMWCDNTMNCADGSDELSCWLGTTSIPNPNRCEQRGLFRCNDGRCIPTSGRCDGYDSCGDKSDEEGCGNGKCEEEPPQIRNGRVVEPFDREDGSKVRYRCNENFQMIRKSSIVCSVPKWVGDRPYCQENAHSNRVVTSNPINNPLENEKRSTTTEAPSSSSSSVNSDTCYCNYDYPADSVAAYARNRPVVEKRPIEKGEIIALSCRYPGMELVSQNGATFYESTVNFTCGICKNWTRSELPYCRNRQPVKCEEEPPRIQNGKYEIFHRENGSEVRYRCDENFEVSINSTVVCNVGKWEGYPVECRERPVQENNSERGKESTTTEAPSSSSSSVNSDTCYCTYDFPDDSVVATSGNRPVDIKSAVRKGETVSLSCRHGGMALFWMNGLSLYGSAVDLTCDTCKIWSRDDLPSCKARQQGDSFLFFTNDMKILPGGIVEISRHKNVTFHCINFFGQPRWHPMYKIGTDVDTARNGEYLSTSLVINGARDLHAGEYDCWFSTNLHNYRSTRLILKIVDTTCPIITTDNSVLVAYTNGNKVNSRATFRCDRNAKLIGENWAICMPNGQWSNSNPTCEKITCPTINTYNSLEVVYTNDNEVNSRATFRCDHNAKLIGENSAICMPNGQWSNSIPTCENQTSCNKFEKSENIDVSYSNDIKVGSIATFSCVSPYTLIGNNQARCLRNGTWNKALPSCEYRASCNMFVESEILDVSYSNDIKVGSVATFSCASPYTLVGSRSARCLPNGTWNREPFCEAPKCSIDSLLKILPQEISPDMKNITTDDYVPYGTELQLVCDDPNSLLSGSSKTKCGPERRWEHGAVRCIQGCILGEETLTSQLIVEPFKGHYLFGESITFSCPTGQELSSEVQLVMCLGTSWSDPIPGCV